MVRHDDEFVQEKAAELAILIQHVEQKSGEISILEKRITEVRDRGNEERAFFLGSVSQSFHQR